jgi:endoglucanase
VTRLWIRLSTVVVVRSALSPLCALALVVTSLSACSANTPEPSSVGAPRPIAASAGVEVEDGRLVTDGRAVQLGGVSRSGTEYSCLGGDSVFAGPTDDAALGAMVGWHVDVVRIPLNEDCWLGINGVPANTSGSSYQQAVETFVDLLESRAMVVDLDLHWSAPGAELAAGQQQMPDADHSKAFWQEVASIFGGDPHVIFELHNEPYGVSWECWRDGCTVPADGATASYRAIGMQQLVAAVRGAGAPNPLVLDGLGHAGDLSQWGAYEPDDPDHALVAGWHVYGPATCLQSCWESTVSGLAGVPVMVTEFGQTDCGWSFVSALMSWLDQRGISYLAWAWVTWPGCGGPSLIDAYTGRPHGAYGKAVMEHLRRRFPRLSP